MHRPRSERPKLRRGSSRHLHLHHFHRHRVHRFPRLLAHLQAVQGPSRGRVAHHPYRQAAVEGGILDFVARNDLKTDAFGHPCCVSVPTGLGKVHS